MNLCNFATCFFFFLHPTVRIKASVRERFYVRSTFSTTSVCVCVRGADVLRFHVRWQKKEVKRSSSPTYDMPPCFMHSFLVSVGHDGRIDARCLSRFSLSPPPPYSLSLPISWPVASHSSSWCVVLRSCVWSGHTSRCATSLTFRRLRLCWSNTRSRATGTIMRERIRQDNTVVIMCFVISKYCTPSVDSPVLLILVYKQKRKSNYFFGFFVVVYNVHRYMCTLWWQGFVSRSAQIVRSDNGGKHSLVLYVCVAVCFRLYLGAGRVVVMCWPLCSLLKYLVVFIPSLCFPGFTVP